MSQSSEDHDREGILVVGLDIGTTYSGLSFQVQKHGVEMDDVREVRGWPCLPGYAREADQVKVPTKLDYSRRYIPRRSPANDDQPNKDDHEDDEYDRPLWGYLVTDDNQTTIEAPKLLLLDQADLPTHLRGSPWLDKSRKRVQALKKKPAEVIADYIRQLWKHAFGDKHTEGYIDRYLLPPLKASTMRTHVVVTIPAIWKNSAMQAMRNALNWSILGEEHISFEFTSEPEAAMMAYAGKIRNQMKVNDVAVCVDLGGGTADCISYRLASDDRLAWEEIVPGDGDLCGAMFLDEAFQELLQKALQSSDQPTTADGWKALLRTEWEHSIKRDYEFTSAADSIRKIRLSNVTDQSIDLHDSQLREAFESVTKKILNLVERQVKEVEKSNNGKPPTAILVVGGFGRCPFIRGALKHKFGGSKGNNRNQRPKAKKARTETVLASGIPIMTDRGDIPWTAICRGAVLSKLGDNARIQSRKARFNFGFVQSVMAAPGQGGVWDNLFGCHMIPNTMTWVLNRGDSIQSSDKILQQSIVFSESQEEDPYHESTFYANQSDNPPPRFNKRKVGPDAEFQDRGTIGIRVPVLLNDLPLREDDTGGLSRIFDYDLHINSKGESLVVEAYATHGGQKVGELLLKDIA